MDAKTAEQIRQSQRLREKMEQDLKDYDRQEKEILQMPPEFHKNKLLKMIETSKNQTRKDIERLKRLEEQAVQRQIIYEERKRKIEEQIKKLEEQQARIQERIRRRESKH